MAAMPSSDWISAATQCLSWQRLHNNAPPALEWSGSPLHLSSIAGFGGWMSFTAVDHLGNSPVATQRRAKIVATLGPSSKSENVFRELVRAGLDVARLNFSHGTHPEKLELIQMVRKVAKEEGKTICILGDLQGPKIRTGRLQDRKPIQLETGQKLTITPRDIPGTIDTISTVFPTLAENLEPGSRLLLSDGLIELHVVSVSGDDVECLVINGGTLGEFKGINLPGIPVKVPSLTEKDEIDLVFCMEAKVDAIALSFVRTAEDVSVVKEKIAQHGGVYGSLPSSKSRRQSKISTASLP